MIEKLGLHRRLLRSSLSLAVAALLVSSISYVGVHTFRASRAAAAPSIYVAPGSASVTTGSTVSLTIREDSGTELVNSVQASMTYDASQLQFDGLSEGGVFPVVAATSTSTPGVIRVGRGNNSTPVSGDNPVVTVNFKVIGSSGSAAVSFDKSYCFLVRSSDNQDILQNVGSGSYSIQGSTASATKPILYINPTGGSFAPGSTVAASVRLNAYTTPVTTVEAVINYPAGQLQYLNVSEGGVFTTVQRTAASTGSVDIIRGIPGGASGVQGDNAVVTVNFKVIGSSGTSALAFGSGSAAYDNSGTGSNILNLNGSAGASYAVASSVSPSSPPPASPPPPPASNNASQITSPSQALTLTSLGGGSVSLANDENGQALPEVNGQIELAPVIDPSVFAANPGEKITKVEYYLSNRLISTRTKVPFTYTFDTTAMRNGTYTVAVKTYYSGGTVDLKTDKLLVKNKVTLAYVAKHYGTEAAVTVIILVALVVIVWKLVLPRLPAGRDDGSGDGHEAMYSFSADSSDRPVAGDPAVIMPSGGPFPVAAPAGGVDQPLISPTVAPAPVSAPAPAPVAAPMPAPPSSLPPVGAAVPAVHVEENDSSEPPRPQLSGRPLPPDIRPQRRSYLTADLPPAPHDDNGGPPVPENPPARRIAVSEPVAQPPAPGSGNTALPGSL